MYNQIARRGGGLSNLESTRTLECERGFPELEGNCVISLVADSGKRSHRDSTIVLQIKNESQLRDFYRAFTKGGKVEFELQEISSGRFQAIFSDALGVTWNLSYLKPK